MEFGIRTDYIRYSEFTLHMSLYVRPLSQVISLINPSFERENFERRRALHVVHYEKEKEKKKELAFPFEDFAKGHCVRPREACTRKRVSPRDNQRAIPRQSATQR